jgi:hypothetical protein
MKWKEMGKVGRVVEELMPNGRTRFWLDFDRRHGERVRLYSNVEEWIIQCLVGRWAETKFRGADDPTGAANDYIRAVNTGIATEADFSDERDDPIWNGAFWKHRDGRAREFVEEHWPKIQAVAADLLRSGKIDGPRVAGLIGQDNGGGGP